MIKGHQKYCVAYMLKDVMLIKYNSAFHHNLVILC